MAWLIANWRLVGVLAIVAFAAVQTFRLQEVENAFDTYVLEVSAAGREAAATAEAKDAHNELVKEEMQHDVQSAQADRDRERAARGTASDRFDSLYRQYYGLLNADPGRGAVPKAGDGAGAAVHAGGRLCFDQARLVAVLRRELGTLYSELESLARRGEDGVDDRLHWGKWARLTGVCPQP